MDGVLKALTAQVDAHIDALFASLNEQIAIPSVEGTPAPGAPSAARWLRLWSIFWAWAHRWGFV